MTGSAPVEIARVTWSRRHRAKRIASPIDAGRWKIWGVFIHVPSQRKIFPNYLVYYLPETQPDQPANFHSASTLEKNHPRFAAWG